MQNNQNTKVQCSQCRQNFRIPFDRGDLNIKCPSCGKTGIWRENSKSHFPELLKQIINSKVQKMRSYVPKIGIIGGMGIDEALL